MALVLRALAGLALLLAGCASTKVETTGTAPKAPLCDAGLSALILWRVEWRTDQKDARAREEAALRGIEDYFERSGCFGKVDIRSVPTRLARSDREVLSMANQDRIIILTVRELGPVVRLGAALVEGGTEVVLELRALDRRTGARLADSRTHWQHGGAWAISGVASLPQDMSAAVRSAMSPTTR